MDIFVSGEFHLGVDPRDHFDDRRLFATHNIRKFGCENQDEKKMQR